MNQYVILILGIWFACAISCAFTKNSDPMFGAFVITVLIGFGYLILQHWKN